MAAQQNDEQLDQAFAKFRVLLDELPADKLHEFGQLAEEELKERQRPKKTQSDLKLDEIVQELRKLVPATAEAPNEKITIPRTDTFKDWNRRNTLHVDSFLYPTDEDIDELCDEGLLSRNYCGDCGSRNVSDLNFVSHSLQFHS